MVSDKLNEIYRNVENPFAQMQQSDLYKLWEQRNRQASPDPLQNLSLPEKLIHAITGMDAFAAVTVSLGIPLILISVVMLIIDKRQRNRKKKTVEKPPAAVEGTIINAMLRQEGKKKRRYGIVEFTYNGFRYTQGFYLPVQDDFEQGKKVTVLVDPYDIRRSRIKTPFDVSQEPFQAVAQWFMIIGITLLLCGLL